MSLVSEQFIEGRRARRDGKPLTANPEPPGTRDYNDWRKGWMMENRYV